MMNKLTHGVEFALAEVCFRVPNRTHPDLDKEENYCNTAMPHIDDTIWLGLNRYDPIIETPFWVLYENWSTFLNGMDDAPEDLDLVRLVRCERISPFEPSEYANNYGEPSGLLQVRCAEILELAQIPHHFSANEEPFILNLDDNNRLSRYNHILRSTNLTFYTGGTEGVAWYSIATNTLPRRLVLSGFFLGREDKWEICNCPFVIVGDEEEFIKKMAAKAQELPPPPAFCQTDERPT